MKYSVMALMLAAVACGSDPFAVVIVDDPEHVADGASELVLSLSSGDAVRRVPLDDSALPVSLAVKSKTSGAATLSVAAQDAAGMVLARGVIALELTTDSAIANRVILSKACETASVCDDGRSCNGIEECLDGRCTAGPGPLLDDGNECTADACDEELGVSHLPVPDGQTCSAVDRGNGVCFEGACTLCGNGVVDFGEDGEDGNTVPFDGLTNCRNSERQIYLSANPNLTCKLVASGLGPQGQARFSVACFDCLVECEEASQETHTENGSYIGLEATAFASDGSSVFFGANRASRLMELRYIDATPMPAEVPRFTASTLSPQAVGSLFTTDDQLIVWFRDGGLPQVVGYGVPPAFASPTMPYAVDINFRRLDGPMDGAAFIVDQGPSNSFSGRVFYSASGTVAGEFENVPQGGTSAFCGGPQNVLYAAEASETSISGSWFDVLGEPTRSSTMLGQIAGTRSLHMGCESDGGVTLAITKACDGDAGSECVAMRAFGPDFQPRTPFVDASIQHVPGRDVIVIHQARRTSNGYAILWTVGGRTTPIQIPQFAAYVTLLDTNGKIIR